MREDFKKSILNYTLNILIIIFLIIAGYFAYSFIMNNFKSGNQNKELTDTSKKNTGIPPQEKTIQIEVLNGTGEPNVAKIFTDYLRGKGVDVVEIGNYKSSDIVQTIIIDRRGNDKTVKKLAAILGVTERNITQQLNDNLLLDATVLIGKDFGKLKPYEEKEKNRK